MLEIGSVYKIKESSHFFLQKDGSEKKLRKDDVVLLTDIIVDEFESEFGDIVCRSHYVFLVIKTSTVIHFPHYWLLHSFYEKLC